MLSMHSFAQIQRTLLRSAGRASCSQWRSEAAFYAGNALSTTLPGGPVLSATFIYRQQRLWGASPVVASWQLVMSGCAAGGRAWRCWAWAAPSCSGAKNNPFSLIFTLGGFIALLLLAQAVASRPELIDGIGVRVLSWVNSVRGKPADTGLAQVARTPSATGIGQPEPPRSRRGVQLVAVRLDRRRGVSGLRGLRRGGKVLAG